MRQGIETVPKNGDFVILEDDGAAKYAVARWSSDSSQWVDEGGTPCTLNPTHWHPLNSAGYAPQPTDELGVAAAKASPAAMRAYSAIKRRERASRPPRQWGRRVDAVGAGLARMTLVIAQKRYRVPAIVGALAVVAAASAWSYQSEIAGIGDRFLASSASELTQARQALRDVQEKADKLAADLAATQREMEAKPRPPAPMQQEQGEADRLRAKLASATREIETQMAKAQSAADEAAKAKEESARLADELRRELLAEEGKAARLRAQLGAVAREMEAQAVSARTAAAEAAKAQETSARTEDELRRGLQDERGKVEKLNGELAAAKHELETQAVSARTASDEAAKATEESSRTGDELGRALRAERDNAEKLRRELEALARDRDAQAAAARAANEENERLREASSRGTEEGRRAVQAERSRAEKLAGELDQARSELDTLAKAKDSEETAHKGQLAELSQAVQREKAAATQARETAEAESLRRQQLEQQLASRAQGQPERRRASTESAVSAADQAKPAVVASVDGGKPTGTAAARPATAPAQADAETVRLLARASLLLEQGNIAGARNMLDRAAESGNPEAVFALAETYDPGVLAARQTFGTQSDATKARELYAKALAGGVGEARARLDALRQ
jgi:hypothetical protein